MVRSRISYLRLQKQEREGRKLTVAEMAQESGLSINVFQRLINNASDRIAFDTLDTLCAYFGCTVGDLLEYVPDGAQNTTEGELK